MPSLIESEPSPVDPDLDAMYLEMLRREEAVRSARSSFRKFISYVRPWFLFAWFHEEIASVLERWVNGDLTRVMIFLPVQHGKSETASRLLPAYILGKHPDAALVACSYGASLAEDMNRDVQLVMDSDEYRRVFPGSPLLGKGVAKKHRGSWKRSSKEFNVVGKRGVYRCAGVDGPITGKSMDFGIIDDVFKNRQEADSPVHRKHVWDWYTNVFKRRMRSDLGRILIVMTRWHEDDLAGRLLRMAKENRNAEQWHVVMYQGLCDREEASEHDPRQEGEALWPERFSREYLEKERATSAYMFSAIYQQKPSPPEGAIFKRACFHYFYTDERLQEHDGQRFLMREFVLPMGETGETRRFRFEECRWFQVIDTALKATDTAAFTAVVTVAVTPKNDVLVYHVWRQRLEVPEQFGALMEMRVGEAVFDPQSRAFLHRGSMKPWPCPLLYQAVEEAASGIGLLQTGAAAGHPFRSLKATGSKEQRAVAIATMYENGKVWHRNGASWVAAFEDELLMFPNGTFLDQADCMGHVGMLVQETSVAARPIEGELLCSPNPYLDTGAGETYNIDGVEVYFPPD